MWFSKRLVNVSFELSVACDRVLARALPISDIPARGISLLFAQVMADAIVGWTNRDGMRTPDHGLVRMSVELVDKRLEMVWKPLELVWEPLEVVFEPLEMVWEWLELVRELLELAGKTLEMVRECSEIVCVCQETVRRRNGCQNFLDL